ncbi:hypothetical protein L5515_005400 [Caenorhabditis briggsae]|uniref:Uncharacterized protein n=1 Tax=Caenorhabditis briggsae TaxID=6238 RepID=A0AAE9EPN6_CAEBR|nr:hypothetical protein L5515_005400 [Caenorhabditis briggsae]
MLVINEKRGNYMLNELWKLPFNPIYFFLKHFCVYTMTFTFASSIAFWHSYPFVFIISPFIFYPEHDFWVLALISHTSYQIAMFSIPAFMALFSSKYKKHFLQIDFNKFSYHKMVQIVVVTGIIHVSFAAYFIQSSVS